MLKAKQDLEKHIEKELTKLILKQNAYTEIWDYCFEKYNLPKALTSDYISLRNPLAEANEYILYCILDAIEKVSEKKHSVIEQYYVPKEIAAYSKAKYEVEKIKFPMKFKAIQITEDHWISSIDFKTLMKMRAGQIIVYDENTQRTLERIVRGDKEIYRIRLDYPAISKIRQSYEDNTYIPTALTFNIPEDTDADFYYNEETSELIINKLEHFDIVDGYHRYIAACKACDADNKLNRVMELRIVNFPEYKAQQFIFQEDQKTKMPKTESNSYNQHDLANNIVERLNSEAESNLKGLLSRNNSLINYGELADYIGYLFVKDKSSNKNKKSILLPLKKDLIESFNILTEYNPEKYLETKYPFKQMVAILCVFKTFKDSDKTNMCQVIEDTLEKVNELDGKIFYNRSAKKKIVTEIEKIIEEVM